MLTEEAIRNGIESTTRYRPKERPKARQPTKRAGTPSSTTAKTSLDQKTPPNRAASGRRGGLSNSRSAKAAAAERKRIRQQQEQTSQLHLFMKAQLQYQGSSGQPPQQQLALQQRPGMPFDHSYHPQMAGFPPAGEASDLGPFSLSGHFTLSPTSANHPAAASNKACPTYDDGAAAAYQYDDQSTLTTGGGSALDPTFLLEDVSVGRTVLPYMYGQQTDSPVAASTSITPEPSTDYMTDAMYTPRSWSQSAY